MKEHEINRIVRESQGKIDFSHFDFKDEKAEIVLKNLISKERGWGKTVQSFKKVDLRGQGPPMEILEFLASTGKIQNLDITRKSLEQAGKLKVEAKPKAKPADVEKVEVKEEPKKPGRGRKKIAAD